MKKTLTINISGIVFHIDEDAYEKLKNYLSKITIHFSKEEGGHEIISDIEARIAELFSEKTAANQAVINNVLVDEIINIMGLPEDFAELDTEEESTNKTGNNNTGGYYESKRHKLYRDPESRVLGGVCSGLSYYLKIDKILLRILFLILLFVTSGVVIPAYLILWIAVPKAKTTSQKLEMKGEPINVENIGKKVKEEFSEMKDNFDNIKNTPEYRRSREYARRTGQTAKTAGKEAINVFGKIIGVIITFIGLITLASIIFGVFAASQIAGMFPGHFSGLFVNQIFSGTLTTTLMFCIVIIVGIPFLLLTYAGTKMIFNYTSDSKSIILTSLGVWVIGIVLAISTTVGAIDVFSTNATVNNSETLSTISDTLYVKIDEERSSLFDDSQIEINNTKVVIINDEEKLIARPKFTITENKVNEVSLKLKKTSKGSSNKNAKENANNISFNYRIEGKTLLLDPYFIMNDSKWRNQNLHIALQLPVNKVVFIDENLIPIIHDIENTSNTWDKDMTGSYWIMKPDGLTLYN